MQRIAKFEKVSFEQFKKDWQGEHPQDTEEVIREIYDGIRLPKRATAGSAGYDFFAPAAFTLKPGEMTKILTGIRARIDDGWVLKLYPRSGLGFKFRLQLNNTVGIIDSDYYGSDNEGHIQVKLTNDSREGKTVEVEGLCKAYGDRQLIRDFTYIFLKGDRVGITGPNGCGKSTLLKMIVGEVEPDAGTIEIGQTVKIGYFSQESESLDDNMRVIDYIKEAGEYVQTTEGTITAAQMLERFLFDGAMQWSLIGKLSGGEKRRLYLLRILMTAPTVLILDEPTNDLDIRTLTILEDYLDGFDGIVITVSHDRYFLDRVVRRMFAFEENGKIRQYEGGFSDYQVASAARAEENGTPVKAEEAEAPKEKTEKPRTRKLKFTYNEEKEYAVIDEEIEALEEKVKQLDLEIVRNATDYPKLSALTKEKEETEEKLMEKMERWEYLTDLAERIEQERGK